MVIGYVSGPRDPQMDAFLISTGIVALAEIGDKTQLLSFLLAARYKRPWPIIFGIFVATVVNHALAGAVGAWITTMIGPQALRWILGISFIAMAVWMLIPDKLDDAEAGSPRFGVIAAASVSGRSLNPSSSPARATTGSPPHRRTMSG